MKYRNQFDRKYKYQLDRSSRKYICPRCRKKTFVVYLDETGQMLSEEVGKCDRKDRCNWHYTPRQYFQDHSVCQHNRRPGDKIRNSAIDKRSQSNPRTVSQLASSQPPDSIDHDIFYSTLKSYDRNSLMIYLHSVFDGLIGKERVEGVGYDYAVGTSRRFNGSPIFWQIDQYGRIRTGKIMGYSAESGKRVKDPRPQLSWVHSLLKDRLAGDFRMQQCYFGSNRLIEADRIAAHLTAQNREINACAFAISPIVWLFESEKAALIVAMALEWGGMSHAFIPIACGGCEGFNPSAERKKDPYDALQILKGRKVVLFPDQGKFDEWKHKGEALRGFSAEVYISTCMERHLHPSRIECEINPGDALDDLVIRYFAQSKDVATLLLTSYGYRKSYLLT